MDKVQKGKENDKFDIELTLINNSGNDLSIKTTFENDSPKTGLVSIVASNKRQDELQTLGEFFVCSINDSFYGEGSSSNIVTEEISKKVSDYLNYIYESGDPTDEIEFEVGQAMVLLYTIGDQTTLTMIF